MPVDEPRPGSAALPTVVDMLQGDEPRTEGNQGQIYPIVG